MSKKEFPIYESHEDVICFHCNEKLKDAQWTETGYPSGMYKKTCPACTYRTFYDIKEREKTYA